MLGWFHLWIRRDCADLEGTISSYPRHHIIISSYPPYNITHSSTMDGGGGIAKNIWHKIGVCFRIGAPWMWKKFKPCLQNTVLVPHEVFKKFPTSTTDYALVYEKEYPQGYYLFFSSSSLFAFFLWAGISCARSSFSSSLSFLAFMGESLVNWKVKLFPSCRTSCICTLELPSGLIRCTVGNNYTTD